MPAKRQRVRGHATEMYATISVLDTEVSLRGKSLL